MAIRVTLGEYTADESAVKSARRTGRSLALTGAIVVAALAVAGRSSTADPVASVSVQPAGDVERPAVATPVFSSASWRTGFAASTGVQQRLPAHSEPVLLEELVNPRVYANLQGVAICHVGTAKLAEKAKLVHAPFRAAQAVTVAKTEKTAE